MENITTIIKFIFGLINNKRNAQQKEYRIIYADINDDEILGKNVSIEELGLKCSGIYCGINCSKEHYKRLNSIAKTLGVECKKCFTNDERFIISK